MTEPDHIPVLLREVGALLADRPRGRVVDCTIGLGGHARLLLERMPQARLLGLDVDERNLELVGSRLSVFQDRVRLVRANFADLPQALRAWGVSRVDAVLADLGVSSNQIVDPARGLSFEVDGPLDMRLDRRQTTTAADLVNGLSERELSDLLYLQAQERHSRKISKRICEARRQGRLNSTVMLARLVAAAVGAHPEHHRARIHPATRTFLALRMAVNREVDSLRRLMTALPECLNPGGRVGIVSFHSAEDRVVKEDFRRRSKEGTYRLVTRRPVVAGEAERIDNPRSRSAKLRVAEFARENLHTMNPSVHDDRQHREVRA